jgi:predicted GH43/DUF377 family glycosyl hydrolase
MKPYHIPVERCNGGAPIISPTANWWETGVTFNAAAVYLERSVANDPVIRALLPMRRLDDPQLAEGVVAVHYRARPETDPGSAFERSFIGLALFTPRLQPLYRYQEPVLWPSADPDGCDTQGIEDPRITLIDGVYNMVYCGNAHDPLRTWRAALCLARSSDLLHWEKLGPLAGNINRCNNKDGVLFPHPVGGKYYLFHRPACEGMAQSELAIRLASSDSIGGPYFDCGEVLRAAPNPQVRAAWVGAGSVPFLIDARRYAFIYHTGSYLNATDRVYDLDAAIFDFDRLEPGRPDKAVSGRIDHLMTPETPAELRSHSALQVGNVLFACGSYEFQGDIYIIYGGADTYTLAAKVNKQALLDAMQKV